MSIPICSVLIVFFSWKTSTFFIPTKRKFTDYSRRILNFYLRKSLFCFSFMREQKVNCFSFILMTICIMYSIFFLSCHCLSSIKIIYFQIELILLYFICSFLNDRQVAAHIVYEHHTSLDLENSLCHFKVTV